MVGIIFEAHATSVDNEKNLSSGHADPELSDLGVKQARELGERYTHDHFDAIFCSDLKRSFKTAELAFKDRGFPTIKDPRLRECDYGDLTQHPGAEVSAEKRKHISVPFPNGESYEQTSVRMKAFLQDLLKNYEGKKVMIIGHRATQYGLEHWIKGVPLPEAVTTPWQWQPGWEYKLEKI